VVCRRVDVAAVETARFEKTLSILDLCLMAGVDPAAYRHLLRWEGMRSRDRVIAKVVGALGLRIRDVVVFKRVGEEAA
jgi:hypothetical protein